MAMRAGGISVYQILVPVTKVSLVVTLLTLALTLFLLPAGNWNLRKLRQELGVRPVQSQLKPRVFNEEIPGKLLYVDDIDLTSGHWKGVFLNDVQNDGSKRLILAGKGQVIFSPDNRRMQISLEEGSSYQYHNDHADKYSLSSFGTLGVSVDLPQSAPLHQQSKRRPDKHLSQLLLEIRQAPAEVAHGSLVELHRRLALPLAALVFGVLGVTLGMRSHRGGRGYGTIVSMVIALSYYVLFATGSSLAAQGVLNLAVGVWGANLLLAALAWLSLPPASPRQASQRTDLASFAVGPGFSLTRTGPASPERANPSMDGHRQPLGLETFRNPAPLHPSHRCLSGTPLFHQSTRHPVGQRSTLLPLYFL